VIFSLVRRPRTLVQYSRRQNAHINRETIDWMCKVLLPTWHTWHCCQGWVFPANHLATVLTKQTYNNKDKPKPWAAKTQPKNLCRLLKMYYWKRQYVHINLLKTANAEMYKQTDSFITTVSGIFNENGQNRPNFKWLGYFQECTVIDQLLCTKVKTTSK